MQLKIRDSPCSLEMQIFLEQSSFTQWGTTDSETILSEY